MIDYSVVYFSFNINRLIINQCSGYDYGLWQMLSSKVAYKTYSCVCLAYRIRKATNVTVIYSYCALPYHEFITERVRRESRFSLGTSLLHKLTYPVIIAAP